MGGRGTSSTLSSARMPLRSPALQPQQQPPVQPDPIAQQVPDDNNTPVSIDGLQALTQMTDAQLAQAFLASQTADLPNHLSDVSDITQKFVFHMGLNEKPTVLDTAAFNQFMQDNGISQSDILSRSIGGGVLTTSAGRSSNLTPQQIADTMMHSRLNYIGGKHGGQAYGAGTYFDMNGGSNTGYGGYTVNAVLHPTKARIIDKATLAKKAKAFDRSHPQFAKATGGYNTSFYNNNMSVYALAMGYNVISSSPVSTNFMGYPTAGGGYHNVISREALVYKK